MTDIQKRLFAMQDKGYRSFNSKLIPNVDKETVIGVRIPMLRKYAKEIYNTDVARKFLSALPHKYFEENNLHAFLIEQTDDFGTCVKALNAFLPYVDNWATCDSMRPKCFRRNKDLLLEQIDKWLDATHPYTVRFGIEQLMLYCLDEDFDEKYMERISRIKSDDYYVNMMSAWYFATALSVRFDTALAYLTGEKLTPFVHNKTIRKAVESYRITREQKEILRSLTRKNGKKTLF